MNEFSALFLTAPDKQTQVNVQEKKRNELKLSQETLRKHTGKYKWGYGELTFMTEDGRLQLQYTGEDKYPLQALSDSTFMLEIAGLPVAFSKMVNNESTDLTFKSMVGKRVRTFKPSIKQLESYCGTNYSEELFTQYTVRY
jgi:hypothetical protein